MRGTRLSAIFTNIAVTAVVTCLCLVAVEIALRLIDGYRLDRLILQAKNPDPVGTTSKGPDATQYAKKITIDPTFDLAWFHTSPPEYDRSPKYELPADWAEALANYQPSSPDEHYYIKEGLKLLYNYNALVQLCATGDVKDFEYYKKYPGFVYAFASPDASDLPPYRNVPRGWTRGTEYSNNFGFRGPDIVARKSGRIVRVAFLGASVTAGGWPFSYPEYVVHYLRQWARANKLDVDFDLVNAARTGVNMSSIVPIMRYEVAALHPDIVVSYDGGEYLWGSSIVEIADDATASSKPSVSADVQYHPFEQYSAFLSRLYQLSGYGSAAEATKPPHTLNFDLTQNPDLDREDLPFNLHGQIAEIRDVAKTTRSVGGEFFLTSFVGMVGDRVRLDPVRHKELLNLLNDRYFPMTYREIRQSLDFENAVYRKLAQTDHYSFIDVDRYFPQDPDLFGDEYHLSSTDSYRLIAWIIAQQLTPYLREAIKSGLLPKAAYEPDATAIAWVNQPPIKFDLGCRQ
jgi:hypothetical protein